MPLYKQKIIWLLGAMLFSMSGLISQNLITPEIEQAAKKYVKRKKNKGLVISIIKGDGTATAGFGKLGKSMPIPPDENTLFEIGSITKIFTTTLMMAESQAGKFELGDRIQDYLPASVEVPRFQSIICVAVDLHPNATDYAYQRLVSCQPHPLIPDVCITFCDLASHTSGLPNTPKGLFFWNPLRCLSNDKDPYVDYTKEELYGKLHKYELSTAPGSFFKYSNLGIALLGNIVADVSGTSYAELLESTILQPLEMQDTRLELTEVQMQRLAPAHNKKGKSTQYWHFKSMAPAGGLKSSAADLTKFVQANLQPQEPVLRDAFEQVHQSQLKLHEQKLDRPTWMGYGWFTSTLSPESNQPVVWHNGGTGGFRAFIGFVKDSRTGVVILSNTANSVDELGFEILEILNNKTNSTISVSKSKTQPR